LHPRCFNLSDMGTMKTLASLWAADYIMRENPGWRTLVVAPLSTLQRVWGDAIFTHLMGRRSCIILHGSGDKRRKLLQEKADFYVINHDGVGVGSRVSPRGIQLEGLSRDIAEHSDINIVLIDEVSNGYRDGSTRRSRVARATLVQKPYMWCLTGTPTPNGPLDAHGISRLVNNAHGESFRSYKERIMYRTGPWTWVPRVGATDEAGKLLKPAIRFEMRECVDVPPCTEQMRDVQLSPEQAQHYRVLERDLVLDLENGKQITAAHEGVLRLKLLQISCGAIYDSEHNVTRIDCSPRLAVLREVIEEAARKVIIFAPLTSVLHLLYDNLVEYSRSIVNREATRSQKDEIFKLFQESRDPQIIIADPASMSHGLDLYAATTIVWYGATDRAELYLQANRRIDRPGQSLPTTIVQLAATSVEREIFHRAATKQSMQGCILKMVRGK
jgi:SNF2-related domain/Helicase conserved C-terminal domain